MKQSTGKRLLFATICLLGILVVLEAGLRGFLSFEFGLSYWQPDYLTAFYPETARIENKTIQRTDSTIDVLLLGGSVLHRDYSQFETRLREALAFETRRLVRIHNLARPAHTSLDSVYKYRRLADQKFDLVVFYHGINEARANNCPEEMFRPDYSHYAWYERVNDLEHHSVQPLYVTPSALRFLWQWKKSTWWDDRYVSAHRPKNDEWMRQGGSIKTAEPFENNVRTILDLAHQKQEPVLLMTFAYYLADGYSDEAFRARELDYADRKSPVGIWGKPGNVTAAIDAHNQVLRRVGGDYQNVHLVDQSALLPKAGRFFNDICHITHEGTRRFVDNMIPTALDVVSASNEPTSSVADSLRSKNVRKARAALAE